MPRVKGQMEIMGLAIIVILISFSKFGSKSIVTEPGEIPIADVNLTRINVTNKSVITILVIGLFFILFSYGLEIFFFDFDSCIWFEY